MTIREMHIEVERGLSQINANVRRSFEPEEIDMELNRQIALFVDRRIGDNADLEQLSMEEIITLTTRKQVEAQQDENDNYLIHMPADFSHLLAPDFFGKNNCDAKTLNSGVQKNYYGGRMFPPTEKANGPFYREYRIELNGKTIFNIGDHGHYGSADWTGVEDQDSFVAYNRIIEWAMNRAGIYTARGDMSQVDSSMYWADHPVNIIVDGKVHTSTQVTSDHRVNAKGSKRFYASIGSGFDLDELIHTPYYGVASNKAFYTMEEPNVLRVFTRPDCIITHAIVNYVRIPRPVSLNLNSNCDLPSSGKVHQTICTATVAALMGDTSDERYQIKETQETQAFKNI